MERHRFFGGAIRGVATVENGPMESLEVMREVWFDRDIDGRWLVWAQETERAASDGTNEMPAGAIVVRNPDVSAFLEQLGRLIVDPSAFEHEPAFFGVDHGADDNGGAAGSH
jgi:hypothetical protein